MSRLLIGLLALVGMGGLGGCSNRPARPIVPVDQETTFRVYDAALQELKRIMTPKAGTTTLLNWSERMYLNPFVLLPATDSANPLIHDATWSSSAIARGLVIGICGRPPAPPCPADTPVGFISLSPVWTVGGDTVFVQGGYAGEAPGETTYEAVFWIFTIAPDEETGNLKVVRKGSPNRMTFETQ